MKTQQLTTFLQVVQQRSIRAAARAMQLSQPAVTRTIKELEAELGVELLVRSANGIDLTEFGTVVLSRARSVIHDLQRIKEEIASMKSGAAGTVSIAVNSTVALTILPQALHLFQQQMPQAKISVFESHLAFSLPKLREGELDFVIAHSLHGARQSELDYTTLFNARLLAAVHVSNPLATATRLADLIHADWILPKFSRKSDGKDFLTEIFSIHKLPQPERIVHCQSTTVAIGAVEKMGYVSVFTEPALAALMRPYKLKKLRLKEVLPMVEIAAVARQGVPISMAAECFLQALKDASVDLR